MNLKFNSQSDYLPIINGILYENGIVKKYDIITENDCRRLIEISDKPLNEETEYIETTAYINNELECKDINVKFIIGEGSYGGDGFILAESINTKKMRWLISFDDSNPFVKLNRNNNILCVENNLHEKWIIDIHNLDNISLTII